MSTPRPERMKIVFEDSGKVKNILPVLLLTLTPKTDYIHVKHAKTRLYKC